MGGFPYPLPLIGVWGFLCVVSLFGAMPARVEADPAVREVSWSDVVGLLDRHPTLVASQLRTEAAKGAQVKAGAVPNPTLSATLGQGFGRDRQDSRLEWELELSLPLDWAAQRKAKRQSAEAEVDSARALTQSLRREVLQHLGALFWTIAALQAKVAHLEEMEAQTAQLVASVEKRVEKGEARPGEATRIAIELDKVSSELDAERISLSALRSELRLWLGAPADAVVEVRADLRSLPTPTSLDRPASTLRELHPMTAVMAARVRALDAEVTVERRGRMPALAVVGYASSELDRNAYGGGLSLDLPLWSWNQGRIAQAQAMLAAQQSQSQADLLELENRVVAAQAACRSAQKTSERLGHAMVPRARDVAATAQRSYELGEANLLELIDARRTLLEAQGLYLDSLSNAHIECSRLAGLAGEEMP
ncbi:MAG: TolC family protein [Myxococcota bacterium]|jgi:cobalt-zinc-cadmium efflux system outer membrane protein|nr:TolC family protein [Myxococcota bacterium]